MLAFSKDDPGAAARVVKDFAKDNDKLVATLVSLGGPVLPGKDLDKVAESADPRTGSVDAAWVCSRPRSQKFVGTVAAPHTKLVRTLAAVRDQKQAAARPDYPFQLVD